jgi:aspartate racemase
MKIAGMIGGLGPESTIDYYKLIVERFHAADSEGRYPALVITSLDLSRAIRLVEGGSLAELTEYLVSEIRRLAAAGADFAFMSANTPHVVLDEVRQQSPVPLISIVEAACEHASSAGYKRLGLLGTRFTMQGSFYPKTFAARGLTIVPPAEEELAYVHDKYMGELVRGTFLPETRDRISAISESLRTSDGVDAVLVAGTELPLLLRDCPTSVPYVDTTDVHVNAIVRELLAQAESTSTTALRAV